MGIPNEYEMEKAPEIIARQFLNRTNRHLFLTGKAGTGKTTFLRGILGEIHKKAVIAAPTGVAAINAGGVTLHSLFQLPFGTYIPTDEVKLPEALSSEFNTPRTLMRAIHMHGSKRRLIQEMELLIIDEVSMLRADILDAINQVLQSIRRQRGVPFGGVQVLFIGDLMQLPPVVKEDEWMVLKHFYRSIHFFEALALKDKPPLYLEMEKVYRQTDSRFIKLLNHFRDNKVSSEDIEILNAHYQPGFKPRPGAGYIYLTTHNRIADSINREELQKLKGKSIHYQAEVEKDFSEHLFPLDGDLVLKENAQVMFIKNDISGEGRFYNGKIGTVISISGEEIEVGFNDGSDPVQVEKHTWYNKRYRLNKENNEIKEEVMGTFTQYPLKLAWAVTVHKSQGLTFEKAIIDVENAFAPGQIYVALSRLVSLEGLVLSSRVPFRGLSTDQAISAYASSGPRGEEIDRILEQETHLYIREKLVQYYDFSDLLEAFGYHLNTYTKDEKRSAKQRYKPRIAEIQSMVKREKEFASRFRREIEAMTTSGSPDYLRLLHERVLAALHYFEPRLKEISGSIIYLIDELKEAVGVKSYLNELKELEASVFSKLQSLRKAVALVNSILQNQELGKREYVEEGEKELRKEMEKQTGTKSKTGKKGKSTGARKGRTMKKGDSAKMSYEMLKAGKTIPQIASEREMAVSTIESHMLEFLRTGDLDILEILDEEKVSEIRAALRRYYKDSIVPVKKMLGNSYSYSEIRMVMAGRGK